MSSSSCVLPFDSPEARALSARIQEEIYFHALVCLLRLAEKDGPPPGLRRNTRGCQGEFQFDLWGVTPTEIEALEWAAGTHRATWTAQLAADRDCADGYDCLHRRLL